LGGNPGARKLKEENTKEPNLRKNRFTDPRVSSSWDKKL